MSETSLRNTKTRFQLLLATVGGIGFIPHAPGTIGSAVALVILWFVATLPLLVEVVLFLGLFFLGVWASGSVEDDSVDRDPGYIIIDEFMGMWMAVFFIPTSTAGFLFAFLFFRIFDIVKPAPIDRLQQLKGGWGIMLDDILAGLFAGIIVLIGTFIL
ncbi:MAG TPA: phosphatidylglycerophosphatase A [bacterium]|nr:phosphatidylglycerophosphatase A [bacterium]